MSAKKYRITLKLPFAIFCEGYSHQNIYRMFNFAAVGPHQLDGLFAVEGKPRDHQHFR